MHMITHSVLVVPSALLLRFTQQAAIEVLPIATFGSQWYLESNMNISIIINMYRAVGLIAMKGFMFRRYSKLTKPMFSKTWNVQTEINNFGNQDCGLLVLFVRLATLNIALGWSGNQYM